VIEDDGARLRFRHDLIRDALYDDVPGSVRLGLHREAGQRLAEAGAPALQVAEHLGRAARPGDTEAIHWLIRAGRQAAATSPAGAAGLLAGAAGLMDRADPGQDTLLAEQAEVLTRGGQLAEPEAACRALIGRDRDPSITAEARICLGRTLISGGRTDEAVRELEVAAGSAAPGSPERAAARAYEGFARLSLGDLDGAASAAAEARSAAGWAEGHGQARAAMASLTVSGQLRASETVATMSQALIAQLRGELDSALQMTENAGPIDRSQAHELGMHLARGQILTELDRLDEARSTLQTGMRVAEELGDRTHLPLWLVDLALERFTAGDWDGALADAQAGLELAEESGVVDRRVSGRVLRSLILLHRNDLPGARGALEAESSGTSAPHVGHWVQWARALILEAEGQPGQAYAVLADCWDRCARLGHALEYRVLGPDLVRLALASGDRARPGAVAAAVRGLAEGNQVASLRGAALRCVGLAGDDADTLAAAVAAYEGGARPLELAGACEDAGAAWARRGRADRARPVLEQALVVYQGLDAERDLARVEAVLRRAGIRRSRRGGRARPQLGWPSLTPAEQAVARLVADGLTNPQIGARLYISRRTVQTHLLHIITKLDIGSRAQLAAQVARGQD
jgi:DNA-binding CsgD family transcriptional regulator/tetratricopeptide (TPR) repeat protein